MKLFRTLLGSFWAQNWGCPTHILSHIARYTCTKNCQKIENWPKSRYKPIFRNTFSSSRDPDTQTLSGLGKTNLNLENNRSIFWYFSREKIFSIFHAPRDQKRHFLSVLGRFLAPKSFFCKIDSRGPWWSPEARQSLSGEVLGLGRVFTTLWDPQATFYRIVTYSGLMFIRTCSSDIDQNAPLMVAWRMKNRKYFFPGKKSKIWTVVLEI